MRHYAWSFTHWFLISHKVQRQEKQSKFELMDHQVFWIILPIVWACIDVLTSALGGRKSGSSRLPPGPHPFPIIGNILELSNKPHQDVAKLSKTYGPLMTLKLGSITTIVISSPDIAKEALQKNDQAFSGQERLDAFGGLRRKLVILFHI